MPKKKGPQPPKPWSLHPALHSEVAQTLLAANLDYKFHDADDDTTSTKEYDTSIMGNFICRTHGCGATWSSRRIAITIRLYPEREYNARVYHQRCRACRKLSKPKLDRSYAERVTYRVMKWEGVQMDPPPYERKESKQPHHTRLCEGCKAGHCKELGG